MLSVWGSWYFYRRIVNRKTYGGLITRESIGRVMVRLCESRARSFWMRDFFIDGICRTVSVGRVLAIADGEMVDMTKLFELGGKDFGKFFSLVNVVEAEGEILSALYERGAECMRLKLLTVAEARDVQCFLNDVKYVRGELCGN